MYLAIDYGKKRIGLAVGSLYPRGIGTINNPGSFAELGDKIATICKTYDIELIIMGMPVKKSGDMGELANEIMEVSRVLQHRCGIKVIFEEEAYTSTEAERELRERGVNIGDNKGKIDELASILILEQFIEKKD